MLGVVLAAGFAEEAAYRGLGMLVLGVLGIQPWWSALLLSAAFAVAHAVQGRLGVVIVFAMALVMHALVALTGTLLIAMVVHIAYDLVAVVVTARVIEADAASGAALPG